MRPLLSICIPTYNRAEILKKTVLSIVSERIFYSTNLVEVVVSDNVSTDLTQAVMMEYVEKFQGKVKYIRLDQPIDSHFNFENALKNGQGEYVKLLADATCFCPGKLDQLVAEIQKNRGYGVILTQSVSGGFGSAEIFTAISDILNRYSFNLAWISIYCFKREVFLSLKEPFRYWKLFFPHIDILFRLLRQGYSVISLNDNYYAPQSKLYTNRNDAHIFGECYLQLLEGYKNIGEIDDELYSKEKFNVLFLQIIPFYFDAEHKIRKEKHLGYRVFWNSLPRYHKELYFLISYPFLIIYFEMRKIPFISQILLALKTLIIKLRFRKTPLMKFVSSDKK